MAKFKNKNRTDDTQLYITILTGDHEPIEALSKYNK